MPSIKDLKRRITSTKNTQQTTKAMKMVSAAKLRRAQDAIQAHRPYAKRVGTLIQLVSALPNVNYKSPLLEKEDLDASAKKKLLLVVVTSDRGLCGGFNSTVIKTAQRWLAGNEKNYASVKLGMVGRKGYEFFKNRKANIAHYWPEVGGKVTFAKGKKLAAELTGAYLAGEYDEVKIIYNEFKNAISQQVQVENYLPLRGAPEAEGDLGKQQAAASHGLMIVKPSPDAVLEQLVSKHFAIQSFRILLESQAGEHGARMSAMENATKNAGEMIKKLTLQYNRQRQAGITKELLEIIGGSEAQKGG